MLSIGINGFGRIGKCVFLQLIYNHAMDVKVINAPDFDIQKIESYLKRDSVHQYNKHFHVNIIDNDTFEINSKTIHLLRNRDASQLEWKKYGVNHIIDATGVYLTEEKASQHDVDYIVMSAPAKDNSPLFVCGANQQNYKGEKIVSNASCTTNCITPVLRHLSDHYGIKQANFTTIHASTASQKVVDTAHSKSRTNRSIFNNIIPHSTGASSSIAKILPELEGKVVGTSVRVPVNSVSLVDLNVELETESNLETILETMKQDSYLQVLRENIVSSDLLSSECPSIVDEKASMELGNNHFKLMIWYDNEWSYASQLIKLVKVMYEHNSHPHFIENLKFHGKDVLLRLDLNVPVKDGEITSHFRITSAVPTIQRILKDEPNRLIIASHFGRPKGVDKEFSIKFLVPELEKILGKHVGFLNEGLHDTTLQRLKSEPDHKIYLMENLRFHEEETKYKTMDLTNNSAYNVIQQLGTVYVNDAFGCMHRDHLSIAGVQMEEKGYGYLIDKELSALQSITQNESSKKILAIIGGGKMDDKLELLKNLSKKVDHIYICGGNINSIIKNNMADYLNTIQSNKAKITLMCDGLCAEKLEDDPKHITIDKLNSNESFFDIGMKSLNHLHKLIKQHDIVFWNGTLGVVEDDKYKQGSEILVHLLKQELKRCDDKKVIVGGGDTGGFTNNYKHNFTHISTGGGASIEYISFDTLPGLEYFNK
jgi:glyceraldehyde 3-phosphate dehydrogenase